MRLFSNSKCVNGINNNFDFTKKSYYLLQFLLLIVGSPVKKSPENTKKKARAKYKYMSI